MFLRVLPPRIQDYKGRASPVGDRLTINRIQQEEDSHALFCIPLRPDKVFCFACPENYSHFPSSDDETRLLPLL